MTTKFSRIDKILNFNDSPQALIDLMHEWGDSQDKLRAALNVFFVPTFRLKFVEDGHTKTSVATLNDVEFLGAPKPQETQSPCRMFDVDEGNLVEWPTRKSQYCMLSHRWKGAEITLQDIVKARKEYKIFKKEIERENPEKQTGKKNDVQIVLEKSVRDIQKQAKKIEDLVLEKKIEHDISTLLERRLNVKMSDESRDNAINKKDEAIKDLMFAIMERESFQNHDQREELKAGTRASYDNMPKDSVAACIQDYDIANTLVIEAEEAVRNANEALNEAEKQHSLYQDERNFFNEQPELKAKVDKMVRRLQQWKSAIKIQQSVLRAREIFDQNPFGDHKKRYVWLDTCCINKQDADELSQSLSLMGDWYAQSEFTLVQLDAGKCLDSNVKYKFSDYDVKYDWLQFQAERKNQQFQRASHIPILSCFSEIHSKEPEWSERGWTLQELVMSKMTFYVNSDWQRLSRPIEGLGRFYHLIPYIGLYLGRDDEFVDKDVIEDLWKDRNFETLYAIVSKNKVSNAYPDFIQRCIEKKLNGDDQAEKEQQVARALLILAILDGLNVRFPKEMSKESAKVQMAQAVFFAKKDLTQEKNGVRVENPLLNTLEHVLKDVLEGVLKEKLSSSTESYDETKVAELHADYVIQFMLRLLVIEMKKLIQEDRKYVAEFGKVELLKEWSLGTQSTGFVTQEIMTLSRHRRTTVPIDHVYALMGIMGVRLPTFPAEGYCMALSRLLDQVIITHNDVSVFNWTGVDMISPIRGRSMYPSSHEAYAKDSDRNQQNRLIWKQAKGELDDLTASYHDITSMLKKATEYVKDNKPKPTHMRHIERILEIIQKFSLPALKPEITHLYQIITHIVNTYELEEEKEKAKKTAPAGPTQAPRLLSSSIRSFSSGISQIKEQKDSIRRNIFGRKKSEPEQSQDEVNQEPPSPSLSAAATLVESPAEKSETHLSKDDEDKIHSYLDELAAISEKDDKIPGTRKSLPNTITDIKLPKEVQGPTSRRSNANSQSRDMRCPNPIIINNAGIEGIFDVQRVIVTMRNKKKLRRQVAQAVSSEQRISGWCTISTGFANVAVNFSCEKRHLETQLQVVDGVEKHVLEEQSEKRYGHIMTEMVLHKVGAKTNEHEDSHQGEKKDGSKSSISTKTVSSEATRDEQKPDVDDETLPEHEGSGNQNGGEDERLISRMIKFIQEEDMRLIAGEWVLARFSGVEGAKWFLCSLELGSAHHFYGYRIATNEIDFSVAAPEAGLVEVWKNYMNRKKRKMGYILSKYLESRDLRETGSSIWTDIMPQGTSFDALYTSPLKKYNALVPDSTQTDAHHDDDSDSDDSDATAGKNQPLGTKDILQAMGGIGLLKIFELIAKSEAKHLEHHLSSIALKRTPKILHPAIENLSDNRDFLPAMFQSGKRIHMF
ncbi:hypothetical protein V8C37DRAFT_376684 [Trichoderma ceciliae]